MMREDKTKSTKHKTKGEEKKVTEGHPERAERVEGTKNNEALARALADYQNLIHRTEKEKQEIYQRAGKNIVEELLPVLDLLTRAQNYLNDPGLKMALEQFVGVLAKFGIEKVEIETGTEFDHQFHEAVDTAEGGEPGTIAKLVADGYKWKNGGLLRPAKVEVYK